VNPALTLAAYVSRRLPLADAAAYVVAQLLGAIAAAFLWKGLAPKSAFDFASGGIPALGQGMTVLGGAGIEVVLTFLVAFTFWAVMVDDRLERRMGAFAVGLAVVVGGFAGAAFTGAAMNPARWLGPAISSGHFANWLVWVAGPALGALLGSTVYEVFFLDQATEEPEEPERNGEPEAPASEPPAPEEPLPVTPTAETTPEE
jgi:glycerol uptake facilitator-like aquaporin